MKARGKKRKAAGAARDVGATATVGVRSGGAKKVKKKRAQYIQIEDLESDSWRYACMRDSATTPVTALALNKRQP